jgi:hypothetical protein
MDRELDAADTTETTSVEAVTFRCFNPPFRSFIFVRFKGFGDAGCAAALFSCSNDISFARRISSSCISFSAEDKERRGGICAGGGGTSVPFSKRSDTTVSCPTLYFQEPARQEMHKRWLIGSPSNSWKARTIGMKHGTENKNLFYMRAPLPVSLNIHSSRFVFMLTRKTQEPGWRPICTSAFRPRRCHANTYSKGLHVSFRNKNKIFQKKERGGGGGAHENSN